jgi:hypothetical protein
MTPLWILPPIHFGHARGSFVVRAMWLGLDARLTDSFVSQWRHVTRASESAMDPDGFPRSAAYASYNEGD